jgi:spore coat protein U-like protein
MKLNRVFLRSFSLLAVVGSGLTLAPMAMAGTTTASISVSTSIVNNCSTSPATIALGNYDGVVANKTTALQGNGALSYTCTSGDTVAIALSSGNNPSNTVGAGILKNGASQLNYNLYSNSGYSTAWGSTSGTNTVSVTGTGSAATSTIYVSVAAGQSAALPAGSYTDTVTATFTY